MKKRIASIILAAVMLLSMAGVPFVSVGSAGLGKTVFAQETADNEKEAEPGPTLSAAAPEAGLEEENTGLQESYLASGEADGDFNDTVSSDGSTEKEEPAGGYLDGGEVTETETSEEVDFYDGSDTEKLPGSQEAEMEEGESDSFGIEFPDTAEQTEAFQVQVSDDKTEHSLILFSSDLEKLERGMLTEPDSAERPAEEQEVFHDQTELAGEIFTKGDTSLEGIPAEDDSASQEIFGEGEGGSLPDLETIRAVLPESTAAFLTEENLELLKRQIHEYRAGDKVSFYVIPSSGYEVKTVEAEAAGEIVEITAFGDHIYEMVMPGSDVVISAEAGLTEETEESAEGDDLSLWENSLESAAAPRSGITVQKVDANTKMNQDYAFTYAFREGVTTLKSISRYNGTLNERLHNWFGDSNGFTTDYCNSFYGALINDSAYSDPISVLYSNVGEYQGEIVDLKVTAVQWGIVNNDHVGLDGTKIYPCILFYKDRIAFNTISVGTVRFQFEFYKHNTGTKISPKGHVTMADLDGGQGFRVYDNWGINGLYIRNGYDHLKAETGTSPNGSAYLDLRGAEGTATTNSDPKGWCQVDFNGTFIVNWLAQNSWLTGKGPMNAFFISTSQSVGTYEPNPDPEKRTGDAGSSFESMGQHNSEGDAYEIYAGKNFDYVIAQRLLPGNYSKFEVTDTLDSCLTYKSAQVYTSGGQNVTKYFTVSQAGNTVRFAAQAAFLKTDEAMNDVTYFFRINVTAKDNKTISGHNHYKSNVFFMKNSAQRQIVSSVLNDTRTTNDTYVTGRITGSFSVRKVDGEDAGKILTGAEFKLYQWNRNQNQYIFLKNMSYSEGKKVYESGTLTYTEENQGKFRIMESKAPPGYEGGWQKDVDISAAGANEIYEAKNSKIKMKYGRVSILKKDSITGEVIEAGDGEFKILQWNQETGEYEDTVEKSSVVYDAGTGRYLSERFEINDLNEGKFKIVESKNPTGYEGSFEKEFVFDMSGQEEQTAELTVLNSPVVLPAGEITVVKKIKEADIIWAHGNPVFRFRVSGTDARGKEHTYEDFVEYQRSSYIVKDGYAVLSCTFENIPIGNYTVSELETLRYEFESVVADTDNVSISGETGMAELDPKHLQAGLTFVNRKTLYDRYSHTDVIRNIIPVLP